MGSMVSRSEELMEKRRNRRMAATPFIDIPVHVAPLLPFFSHVAKGKLIDLSAGGMAVAISESIPQGTKVELGIIFPDKSLLTCLAQITRVIPRGKNALHGVEFLNLNQEWAAKIEKMSSDYFDCESRIHNGEPEPCLVDCSFYGICSKPQKRELLLDPEISLDITFRNLQVSYH